MRRPAFLVAAVCLPLLAATGCASDDDGSAQVRRNFPQSALRGAIDFGQAPEIVLNGKVGRLSAGARIRDQNNMLVAPSTVVGGRYLVHYTLDNQGLVKDVWVLTSREASVKPWPWSADEAAAMQFDHAAQTWSKP